MGELVGASKPSIFGQDGRREMGMSVSKMFRKLFKEGIAWVRTVGECLNGLHKICPRAELCLDKTTLNKLACGKESKCFLMRKTSNAWRLGFNTKMTLELPVYENNLTSKLDNLCWQSSFCVRMPGLQVICWQLGTS